LRSDTQGGNQHTLRDTKHVKYGKYVIRSQAVWFFFGHFPLFLRVKQIFRTCMPPPLVPLLYKCFVVPRLNISCLICPSPFELPSLVRAVALLDPHTAASGKHIFTLKYLGNHFPVR
jgi:hypothetical protein